MTKETRQLFKFLLESKKDYWVGNGSSFTVTFSTSRAELRISVEANGSFEVLRTHKESGQVMDSSSPSDSKSVGLKGYQDKQDIALVKQLWGIAKKATTEVYNQEVTRIMGKSVLY